ncbi:hypothetical protein AB0M20_13540 [Actinoplanes sp. NPDC051633]|uniref:hypothetical protein n=1 Tax=Actinoplanes sp. NPDC051633 TaxID=3155670 RepID=UPI00343C8468
MSTTPPPRNYGVIAQILGKDDEDDDRPLPDLPPLPEDPRWRIEHLPFVLAVGFALVLCAASAGFFAGGPVAAAGAAAGMLIVTIGISMTTLAIAWADVIRPELVMPVGLAVYVIKFALIAALLLVVADRGWAGGLPMAWSMAVGVVVLTGVQVMWLMRIANRRLPS